MTTTQTPVLTVDDAVLPMLLDVRSREADADDLGLVVAISGIADGEFTYSTAFMRTDSVGEEDIVFDDGRLPIIVSTHDEPNLKGAVLTKSRNLLKPGLTVDNPNTPSPAISIGMEPGDLSGPLAERVVQVVDEAINPSIDSHGGQAQVVKVEDGVVYIRLAGGCQGCGMANVTLTQGIERTLVELIPEINKVVDVTDHAQGENPYYS